MHIQSCTCIFLGKGKSDDFEIVYILKTQPNNNKALTKRNNLKQYKHLADVFHWHVHHECVNTDAICVTTVAYQLIQNIRT